MKCHWCGKQFEKAIYYECHNTHGEYWVDEQGKISSYIFFYFSDDDIGSIRYKIHKDSQDQITLFIRNMEKKDGYKKVLGIPNGPPMEVKDNIPQIQRMYERLKKLAIFA